MKNKNGERMHKSSILCALSRLGDRLRAAISAGAIVTLFSSYDEVTERFENSTVCGVIDSAIKGQRMTKLRRTCSAGFDNSFIRSASLRLSRAARQCTMRFWGVFMLTFSAYVLLMYFIRKFGMFYTAPASYVITSVAIALCSIPLVCEKNKSLGEVLLESRFFSWLLFDGFELRYEDFRVNDPPIRRVSVAFIFGMVLGCLTFFVAPLALMFSLIAMLYFYLSLVTPESAFLVCLFSVPFLSFFEHPTVVLCILVTFILIGYFIKLARYKRVFRFGVFEGSVLLFMFILFFGGMRNASMSMSSAMPVMLVLACGVFISGNLLRTKSMILHAIRALSLSCVLCAVAGILEYLFGRAAFDWLDASMFSSLAGRAVSFFDNPNVLAYYLCLGAPLALSLVSVSENKSKTRWFVGFSLIIVCSVLTWSRGAWIGIAAALIMMLVLMRHTFFVVSTSLLFVGFSQYLLPSGVLWRIGSIGSTQDSSTMYRLNIWRGCADMASEYGFEGIGVGEEAFLRLYPRFAASGAEHAYHAHSLWLQLLLMLGVCGMLIFLVMTFFFYQRGFTVASATKDKDISRLVYGSMSGITGILVSGLFDYSWYNYRVFFAYFVVMGFVCACADVTRAEAKGGNYGYEW